MTTHVDIDAFTKKPLSGFLDSSIPQATYSSQPNAYYNMNNLQNILQGQLLGKVLNNMSFLHTGDPMLDMIITTLIQTMTIGLVTIMVTQIRDIMNFITSSFTYIITKLFKLTTCMLTYPFKCRNKKIVKTYSKTVDIPYISDNRQINELYKAVYAYLTNDKDTDYLREPYLQYVFDKKITIENKDLVKNNLSLNKILTRDKSKTIKYKNREIKYSLSSEVITVYTDRDRKRENYKVSLSTTFDEYEKCDILEEFSQFCLAQYIENLTASTWVQQIYTNSAEGWKPQPSNNTRKLDTIILKNSLKEDIKNDLQLFLNSEDWYKDRDIPYTRGYMFYGYPGTGKTTMIKGLSLFCKRHIHFLMLSNIQNDEQLLNLMKGINYKDTILVIEDIDATLSLVKSREEEEKKVSKKKKDKPEEKEEEKKVAKPENKLTLSGLLNALDGVFTAHGRILIMTTNHPEVLDSALIRPGRIDSKYLFDNCDRNQIKELYQMFFNKEVDYTQLQNIKYDKYSPAHITSVFLRYRNHPDKALNHLDDLETKIVLPKLA